LLPKLKQLIFKPIRLLFSMRKIPNNFHFVFGLKEQNEPFHLMFYLCLKSCLEVNRPDKIFFYYSHEPYGVYWELIRPHLEMVKVSKVDFLKSFDHHNLSVEKYSYAHHADFIRVEKLIEHGGIYADMDTLFIQKIPDRLFDKPYVLGREPDIWSQTTGKMEKSLCNALIMSQQGASFGKHWLKEMPGFYDGTWSNHSTVLPQKLSEQYPDEIHIEPQRSFYHFSYSKEDLQKLFMDCTDNIEDVYSIHLWNHLWFSRLKNDYSSFHGGKLNYSYILQAESTYAKLARPFLPDEDTLKQTPTGIGILEAAAKTSRKVKQELEFLQKRVIRKLKKFSA
jgi:hypothetical protein